MVRRTKDGIEVSSRFVKLLTSAIPLLVFVAGVSGAIYEKNTQLVGSLPRTEFERYRAEDSLHTLWQDSLLVQLVRDLKNEIDNNHALTCHVYHNPQPFCDAPAAEQAGTPRGPYGRP